MLRTILAGLVGTRDSQAALALGVRWARLYDALLVGVVVIGEPGLHGPEEWILGESEFMRGVHREQLHAESRKVEHVFEVAAIRCAAEGVAFKPLEDVGDPYTQILQEAQRYDLIVLSQTPHFQYGFDKQADDTLTRVLRAGPRPVVVVPEPTGWDDVVVIAYDGSLQASRSL
jgi:nucleotide-binding universal stress UspA family protein